MFGRPFPPLTARPNQRREAVVSLTGGASPLGGAPKNHKNRSYILTPVGHPFITNPARRFAPITVRQDWNAVRQELEQVSDSVGIRNRALAHGLSPCVTTNGLLLDEPTAREFGRRELLWLNVSLEGGSPATNDLIRGHGSFGQVMENLKILARHAKFSLAFTVMRTNLHEIGKCAELARNVGAESAVFRPLYPVGTARKHLELMPSFAEYNSALRALADPKWQDVTQNCEAIPFSPASRQPVGALVFWNHGCGAGNLVCSISNSGDVSPCSFLGFSFEVGNIRDRLLSDLWRDASFERFRKTPPKHAAQPHGFNHGCRARALWLNGSVEAPDPWIVGRAANSYAPPANLTL